MDRIIKQFDKVIIRTTENVKYMVAPSGTKTNPEGIWTVLGILNQTELLMSKDSCTCRIPYHDVIKVDDHFTPQILEIFNENQYRRPQKAD